jgi:type I pantothenate kinase
MTMRESDLVQLRGINEQIDLDEVVAVYLPLSRLLNLYVNSTQDLHRVSATFLGNDGAEGAVRDRSGRQCGRSARARSPGSCRRCWPAGRTIRRSIW